jgi:hypothetical protein
MNILVGITLLLPVVQRIKCERVESAVQVAFHIGLRRCDVLRF